MNKKSLFNTTAKYYLTILLSVLDIAAGLFCAVKLFLNLMMPAAKHTFGGAANNGSHAFSNAIYMVVVIICVIAYPVLTKMRQTLRDEVEYDENGVSRKHGSFSQLSKAEREAIEQQKMIDAERILPSSFVKSATHIGVDDPEAELKKLIGLENVKTEVEKMVARMEFEYGPTTGPYARPKKKKRDKTHTLSSMNMIMLGNPGTGKTTVARIMAAFLYKYGYVKKNQSIEVDGNFFNGLSKGESSKRTEALIRAARGGVLFIDEAYALLTGGQEVIATIVKCMEDYRDDTVFIFAGYEREMADFIESNSGIKSRMKYFLHFADYNDQELRDIFILMAGQAGFCVTGAVTEKAIEILSKKRLEPFFGNARDVRNLVDKAIDNHALNVKRNDWMDPSTRYYLLGLDL